MSDLVDLRQFRSAQLDELLAAEIEEWRRELDWDYTSSAALIRQYLDARILPGYVLVESSGLRARPIGFGFFVYEGQKGLVGDLFVHPQRRAGGREGERLLLDAMIETLQGTPGLLRVEAQLMGYGPGELGDSFTARGFAAHRRLFLHRSLVPADAGETPPPPDADLMLETWRGAQRDEAAAQLILAAYRDHVDARINDQYRAFPGALRFLHNISHYPGCGAFDGEASIVLRSRSSGQLEGMVLVSRVRPDVAHLTQVCVAPGRRGKGLGGYMLAATLRRLARAGLRAVTLTVTRENVRAVHLYQRLGFRTWREFDAQVWTREAA